MKTGKQGARFTNGTKLVGWLRPQAPDFASAERCGCGVILRLTPVWQEPKSKKALCSAR